MKVLLYRPRITDRNCQDLHKRKKTEMVTGETVRSCFLENVSVNLRLNSSHTSQNMSKFYLQIKRLPVRVTVSNVSGALALHLILLEYCVASDLFIILQISLRGHWIPELLSDCFEHASPILGPSDARIIIAGDINQLHFGCEWVAWAVTLGFAIVIQTTSTVLQSELSWISWEYGTIRYSSRLQYSRFGSI